MAKKIYHFVCWTKDVVDVEIEAKSRKETDEKLQKMLDNDRVRWDKSWTADSGTKYLGMIRKEA